MANLGFLKHGFMNYTQADAVLKAVTERIDRESSGIMPETSGERWARQCGIYESLLKEYLTMGHSTLVNREISRINHKL